MSGEYNFDNAFTDWFVIAYMLSTLSIDFVVSGFSFGLFLTNNVAKDTGATFVISPMVSISQPSCLTFRYFLRSDLKLSVTNSNGTTLMAAFQVDGGFDFHQAFIDLPIDRYKFIWEVKLDQLGHVEIIRNYYAAIDDIEIGLKTCAQLRKFLKPGIIMFWTNEAITVKEPLWSQLLIV